MFSFKPSEPWHFKTGIAIIRIITGVLLIYHGWECFEAEKMKLYTSWFVERRYDSPMALAYLGKGAELVAGIGFVLGLLTRLSCIAAIVAFTGIIFMLGDKGKIFEGDQHPFLFILLALVFFFTGPGNFSVDKFLFGKKK